MKKASAVILALTMLFTATFASAQMFADMEEAQWDWARATVEELAGKGIIKGYSEDSYGPANVVTHQEAFTLFARILGVNDDVHSEIAAQAQALYQKEVTQYETYAERELCFMLYRGILTEAEVAEYLAEDVKNLPIQRHEAAKLITKILGGEADVEQADVSEYEYTDEESFPEEAEGYIAYVTEQGIMSGMGDGSFSAETGVTRAQIAIILKRTMDVLEMEHVEGKVVGLSEYSFAVNGKIFELNENVIVHRDGAKATVEDLKNGDEVLITTTYKGLLAIDSYKSDESNTVIAETVDGIYRGLLADATGTYLRLQVADGTEEAYLLADGASYLVNGKVEYLPSAVRETDAVRLSLVNGGAINIIANTRIIELTGAKVLAVNLEEKERTIKIAHVDQEFDGKELSVAQDATIVRNEEDATMADILVGDILDVSVKYGEAIEIVASSKKEFAEGTIHAIHIEDGNGYVMVDMLDLTQRIIFLSDDVSIVLDDKASNIYGLKLGYYINAVTENDVANEFHVSSKKKLTTLDGEVTLVNPNIGFFNIDVRDEETGTKTSYQIFVNEDTNIFQGVGGEEVKFDDISIGDVLVVRGAENLGAFEATAIVIIKNK